MPSGTGEIPEDAPLRLADDTGRLIAIGRRSGTKILPDKVLIDAVPPEDR